MGGNIFLTYKRKRLLFSTRDNPEFLDSNLSSVSNQTEKSNIVKQEEQSSNFVSTIVTLTQDEVGKNAASTSAAPDSEDNSSTSRSTKRKLSSTLLTFCRRSKRKLDEVEHGESKKPAVSSYVEIEKFICDEEQKKLKKPVHSRCFPAPEQSTEMFVQQDDRFLLSRGDGVTSGTAARKIDSLSSLNLSISSPACQDIDCNQPLDSVSEEKPNISSGVPHGYSASFDYNEENRSMRQQQWPKHSCSSTTTTDNDKGKRPMDSHSMDFHQPSTGTFLRNSYLELFPENRNIEKVELANEIASQFHPKPPFFHSVPIQPEHIFPGDAPYCWPHGFPPFMPAREPPHLFSGQNVIPDDAYRSISMDMFPSRIRWLDEELDSLWIGVRRHGQGNFEMILRDQRLHFLSWKTPRDLADKWKEEQHKLLYGPQEVLKAHTSNFLRSFPDSSAMDQLRSRPGTYSGNYSFSPPWCGFGTNSIQCNEALSRAGSGKGSLPHWLREAAVNKDIPERWMPDQGIFLATPPAWLNSRDSVALRRSEPEEQVVKNRDDMTIVRSDASSEETISDDHSVRT